jgi:flavodoxin
MTASTFDLLPDGSAAPAFPTEVSGEMGVGVADLAVLGDTPVAELRELNFPYPSDATDVFTLKTDQGTGYLDQGTGALLNWSNLTGWERVSETVYMLHTGQGAAMLGLVLGIMALGVPAMGATGVLVWLAARRGRPRIRGNQPAGRAETILLVGSEGGSTWGFAATLHAALTDAGQSVHVAPMSGFAPARYFRAERIIVLAATYGDGDAPASAKGFLDRLSTLDRTPDAAMAVLGFGDRSFPAYCAFAQDVAAAAEAKGWAELLPFDTIDRQSPQDFARWGRARSGTRPSARSARCRDAYPDLASRLRRRRAGADRDPALCSAARHDLAAADRSELRALRRGRPDRHYARGIARAAPLLARLGAPRRICRDRGQEASRWPLLRPADSAGTRRHGDRFPAPQSRIPAGTRPRASHPDRRRDGYRTAGGIRARQCAAATHPLLLRDAPSGQ